MGEIFMACADSPLELSPEQPKIPLMTTAARFLLVLSLLAGVTGLPAQSAPSAATTTPAPSPEEATLARFYTEALAHGQAFENLRALVTLAPGRLAGSAALDRAVGWGQQTLGALALDRVYTQDVMVPHWERGPKESVTLLDTGGSTPLTAVALGGSVPGEVTAEVVEVTALDQLEKLGREKLAGKIVFFNRPMNPASISAGRAYGEAGDARNRGPGAAGKYGVVGALTRSLTHAHDDVPHTGATTYVPDQPKVPAAALSFLAADKLAAALTANPHVRVSLKINSHWYDPAPSHNVIGEIRGSEFPDQILLVGGHLDSWDIAPGAHDDGTGIVQSIEVLRLFRTLGLHPRHTLRCVLFVNEENGLAGATAYASAARTAKEKHLLALESDNGGFQPRGFSLGSTQGNPQDRAARWLPLFQPYGIFEFRKGNAGSDVSPLMVLGATVGELAPDSQRYFDIHHTTEDSLDKVNPRELEFGAASLAALVWLVDTQGL
jgi:carboxypeptidase Q